MVFMANIGQRIIDEPMILTEHISQWEIMVLHLCLQKNPSTISQGLHRDTNIMGEPPTSPPLMFVTWLSKVHPNPDESWKLTEHVPKNRNHLDI